MDGIAGWEVDSERGLAWVGIKGYKSGGVNLALWK